MTWSGSFRFTGTQSAIDKFPMSYWFFLWFFLCLTEQFALISLNLSQTVSNQFLPVFSSLWSPPSCWLSCSRSFHFSLEPTALPFIICYPPRSSCKYPPKPSTTSFCTANFSRSAIWITVHAWFPCCVADILRFVPAFWPKGAVSMWKVT